MKRLIRSALFCFILSAPINAMAQTTTVLAPVPSTTMLAFDHDGVSTDGYAIWVDGTRTPVTTALVGTMERRTAFPALTPGMHTIEATAYVMVDGMPIDSVKSATLTILIVVVPTAPGLPRTLSVTVLGPNNQGLRLVNTAEPQAEAGKPNRH